MPPAEMGGGGGSRDTADKAREEFFSEAQEIVDGLSRDLLALDAVCRRGASDPELVNEASHLVSAATARDSRALEFARKVFLESSGTFRLEAVLPLLQPLPLEPAYALYDRYEPPEKFEN